MPRFVEIFGSVDEITRKLVWLPTWHQACLICREMSLTDAAVYRNPLSANARTPTEELIRIYELIIEALQNRRGAASSLSEHP
jgi:hypothetical protein